MFKHSIVWPYWTLSCTLCKNFNTRVQIDDSVPLTSPASALGDSMDQLSQRSSSERTHFMSREDLDPEGSLDLDREQYQYQDQDQNQSPDQELDHHAVQDEDQDQKYAHGANMSTPTKTLELKVPNERVLPECKENCLYCSSNNLYIVVLTVWKKS